MDCNVRVAETTSTSVKRPGELLFTLLENDCRTEGLEDVRVFGIRCELFSGGSETDSCEVPDVTSSRGKAISLIRLLQRNEVTPCTLRDVVEDWAAEGGLCG